jgi:hypothetical protein
MKPSYMKRGNYNNKKLSEKHRINLNPLTAETDINSEGRVFENVEDIQSNVGSRTNKHNSLFGNFLYHSQVLLLF